jgi:hypothetical protein
LKIFFLSFYFSFNESFNEESEDDARADAKLFLEEARVFKNEEVNI